MFFDNKVYAANAQGKKLYLLPAMANRHGLITGATGTGKTVTMKVLAESFSDMGVPVFLADVKGDVSGLAEPGADSEGMQKRIDRFDLREYWISARRASLSASRCQIWALSCSPVCWALQRSRRASCILSIGWLTTTVWHLSI